MSKTIFKARVRPVATAIALAAATALGGCMTDADFNEVATPYAPITPEKRYPISVSQTAVSIDVPVHKKMSRLSGDVRADVQRFIGQYRARGTGRLRVVSPRKARYRTSLAVAISEIRSIINAAGIHPNAVVWGHYRKGAAGTTAPISMSFETLVAIPQECGHWSQNLAVSYDNLPHPNFGCAGQHNLATMVANPNDLVTPRAMTPKHAGRRDVVIETYRVGGATEADTSGVDESGVSEVGNE